MKILIENGRVFDPVSGQETETSVFVKEGVIAALETSGEAVDRRIDAQGCLIVPGFIDLSCHVREPGDDQKGSIASETRAAAHGGFTTLCTSPDSSPVNDSGAVTNLILDVAARTGAVRVLPVGAITRGLEGELLSDMAGLTHAGCVALSNGDRPLGNSRVLRRCMAYARTFGLTLFIQPENKALAAEGCAHEGSVATHLGLPGIPEVAETIAVGELLLLAEETGVRLHLSQVSTARSVELIGRAQARGLAVTADVAMHHLLFNESALRGFDSRFHVRPPLRAEADRQGLLAGVRDGVITAITSQHRPQDPAAKQAPLAETAPGLSTVETTLGMGLRLVENGELSLPVLLAALTSGPARVLGRTPPRLDVGAPADLCVFAPGETWTVTAASLLSTGKHAAVLGEVLNGVVRATLCDGKVAFVAGGED